MFVVINYIQHYVYIICIFPFSGHMFDEGSDASFMLLGGSSIAVSIAAGFTYIPF